MKICEKKIRYVIRHKSKSHYHHLARGIVYELTKAYLYYDEDEANHFLYINQFRPEKPWEYEIKPVSIIYELEDKEDEHLSKID
ncbi:hypothetical protein D1872_260250 [compost metagenome]